MSEARENPADGGAEDVLLATALLAVAGRRIGGVVLGEGTEAGMAEAWLACLGELLPEAASPMMLPHSASLADIDGSLDLAASLAQGVRVHSPGLAARAAGHVVLMRSAGQASPAWLKRLTDVLLPDEGGGAKLVVACDFACDGPWPGAAILSEALALRLDFTGIDHRTLRAPAGWVEAVKAARERLGTVRIDDEAVEGLVGASVALGVASSRADRQAIQLAKAHAAWRGADVVTPEDAAAAVRFVLAHRARRMPAPPQEVDRGPDDEPAEDMTDQTPPPADDPGTKGDDDDDVTGGGEERPIDATAALLPDSVLEIVARGIKRQGGAQPEARRARDGARTARRGRPIGHRRGDPRRDGALHLLATFERAAPWQALRRKLVGGGDGSGSASRRIIILPDDIRVVRCKIDAPSTVIFAVDASGSSALHRMAEAKGAVELLLSRCYVRRDHVAVVAFGGRDARILLPPTRALARARRALAGLPGGGGTPLASGLSVSHRIALGAQRAGHSCLVVVLTDGRANIDIDGVADRARALADAMQWAKRIAGDGIASVLVDTGARPAAKAADLARALDGRYIPLPHAGAHEIAEAVRAAGG
jgi:magnesium chelatase subunit D